jgi:hypothetical protein
MNGNIKYATLYILLLLQQWVNRCYDDGGVHRRRRRVRVRHDIIMIMRNYWLIEDDIILTLILS